VGLYFQSTNTPSWRGVQFKKESTGTTLSLPLFFFHKYGTSRFTTIQSDRQPLNSEDMQVKVSGEMSDG
jgi:hypothetical protein